MRKLLILTMVLMLVASTSYAANFAPTLLKLTADPIIQYSFDGSELSIPVTVSGHTAGVIFLVYTKGQAAKIPNTRNGYLGWHQVSKVDTCIYFSTMKGFNVGKNNITWSGKNQDGGKVPPGQYTYYMWAFDNVSGKLIMSKFFYGDESCKFQEVDEKGLPLANPIAYLPNRRWKVGGDPLNDTLYETATVPLATDWINRHPTIDPKDFNYFYLRVQNNTALTGGIQKFKWVPGGACELQTDFGNSGYSDLFSVKAGTGRVMCSDGVYLYTTDENHTSSTEPDADFYIFDFEGAMVKEIDVTSWWSSPEALAVGAQMNGGPTIGYERNGMMFLGCHCSCLNQMVDPKGYLESDDTDDFYKWTNTNGDYTLDHNFEETASLRWVCTDYNVGPYKYTQAPDANLFNAVNAYDVGAVSFGLLAPDGTGLGYYAYSGETAGWKRSTLVVDSGTPFDGIYCCNRQAGGTHYQEGGWKANEFTDGIYFIGHDSINGVITSAVGVSEAAPAAFSVAQNSPNPFNPTTTISFSLAQAGNVTVEVYNVAGQKVDTIADGFMQSGSHSMVWNASDFSAGVYFYTVKSGGFSRTMKMTLLK